MDIQFLNRAADGSHGVQSLLGLLIGYLSLRHRELCPVHIVLGVAAVQGKQQIPLIHQITQLKGCVFDLAGDQSGDVIRICGLQGRRSSNGQRQILPGGLSHQIAAAEIGVCLFGCPGHAACRHSGDHHRGNGNFHPFFCFLALGQAEFLFRLCFRRGHSLPCLRFLHQFFHIDNSFMNAVRGGSLPPCPAAGSPTRAAAFPGPPGRSQAECRYT